MIRKVPCNLGLAALALAVAGGLSGSGCHTAENYEDKFGLMERFPSPQPPLFINGPLAVLFTNWNAFSCHATVEMGTGLNQQGEFFGRDGHLLFALEPNQTTGKRLRGGGFSFVWNVKTGEGFALSDPLQGIAPLPGTRQFTNVLSRPAAVGSQKLEGFVCQREDVTIFASDGSTTDYEVWRARDAGNFPIRIESPGGGGPVKMSFSKVRFEGPPEEAFRRPEEFTKYSSLENLVNEYVARQQGSRIRRPSLPDSGSGLGITPR